MRDLRPLGWARAAIGILLLLRTTPLLYGFDPQLFDTWPLLGWAAGTTAWSGSLPLPEFVVHLLCIVRTAASLSFALGIWTAPAGIIAGASGYLVMATDPFGFIFTLHLLYQAAILLGLTDSGAAFALRPVPARAPRTSYLLLNGFVASVYFWAGVCKLRSDWLDGRTLALFHDQGLLRGALADSVLDSALWRAWVAKAVALLELGLGPLLLWPRSRRYALVAAFAFHATLEVMAHPDLFGWAMAALLLTFKRSGSVADRRCAMIGTSS